MINISINRQRFNGTSRQILYIVDGLGISGKTKALVDLACGLDRSQYRPIVCCFKDEQGTLTERLRRENIPLLETKCRDGLNFEVVNGLSKIMKRIGPDIVHCYNPRAMLYGGIAAKLAGVDATIGTLSAFACQVPDRTYDFLPQPLSTRSKKNLLRNRLIAQLMKHLVVVSYPLGERFCKYNKIPIEKLQVAPYGASAEEIWKYGEEEIASLRSRLSVDRNDILIGSVGRLVEQKDYPTQLISFALARQHSPRLKMVIAGDGPLREKLEEMVRDLSIQDDVIFLGHCEQVSLLLRSLDIFVLASKFEPYGVAVLEAQLAQLPIIATSVNELPTIIEDGSSGLLVPPRAPEKMAQAMVRLATDNGLRRSLGECAKHSAQARHSLPEMIKKYQRIYESFENN